MNRLELYTFLQTIPKGKVTTYGALAKHFSTSPRAIASMLSANQELDVYPCYKVIHTDGRIGGYRGWVAEKIQKLKNDGIDIVDWVISKDIIL
jgi:O-6-methylguanine DNA methyltransferase